MELPKESKLEFKTLTQDLKMSAKDWEEIEDLTIETRNDKIMNVMIVYNLMIEAE